MLNIVNGEINIVKKEKVSSKNCNGKGEDLESSNFLQKLFHHVTYQLMSMNFYISIWHLGNSDFGEKLAVILWGKVANNK